MSCTLFPELIKYQKDIIFLKGETNCGLGHKNVYCISFHTFLYFLFNIHVKLKKKVILIYFYLPGGLTYKT